MEKELKRIAHYLLLQTSIIPNIGLLHGKMGICIFFFYYAKYTKKKVYQMYAEDLLDEIYKEIDTNTSTNFRDGLSGIAWGISYLALKGFVKGDLDEVLKNIDSLILERDVRRISDTTLETGLRGVAYYILSRCSNKKSSFVYDNAEYLSDLLVSLKRIKPDREITSLVENLEGFIYEGEMPKFDWFFMKNIKEINCPQNSIWTNRRPIGIANEGLAGIGLKYLNVL